MHGTCYSIEVTPKLPAALGRLQQLAEDLYYSWSFEVRGLFYQLHAELWIQCGHNPKLFLRRVSQRRLDLAADDPVFLDSYRIALANYDYYLEKPVRTGLPKLLDRDQDLIAYFSMEFGFHESVPIYSGGLGILAGDHCKAASDVGLPLVAVGLLYRQGYFHQDIDEYGNQHANYLETDFSHLPITPAKDPGGRDAVIRIDVEDGPIHARVWEARVGRVRLYLLDSDVPENSAANRTITYQLYGGDSGTRIRQEMLLGIGGVMALRALGLSPNAWHINEGHGAFQILERCREQVAAGMAFDAALELVGKNTVFTTHTPVAAGHDIFNQDLVLRLFGRYLTNLDITPDAFLSLGSSSSAQGGFNMTALALRGARFCNGVSRIHGTVASSMEGFIWPEVSHEENPIGYVTNGVHLHTFLAPEWRNLFDMELGHEWRNQLINPEYWNRLDQIPDYRYWSVRQTLKSQLIKDVQWRIRMRLERIGDSRSDIEHSLRCLDPSNSNTLVIGFARRFATYKRATLILRDIERLRRLLNTPGKPVIMLFAGKAHPSDLPGQELIRHVYELSQERDFRGKIIFLEGYNMGMARRLVAGVDVWLNTPEYPLEASGTSGQKAGLNGVINLSVLDGWWGEGYDGNNGWAVSPHPKRSGGERDQMEARTLLDLLEYEVIPSFFDFDGAGYSESWVRRSKASMKTILPRFNSQRMVMDYARNYYARAIAEGQRMSREGVEGASLLAQWKHRVTECWPGVSLRRLDEPVAQINVGESVHLRVGVKLASLTPADVIVECLIGRAASNGGLEVVDSKRLTPMDLNEQGEMEYGLDFQPGLAGLQYYKIRVYPFHPLMTHPFELGLMRWD